MIIIRDVQGGVSIPCLSKRTISGRPLILGLVQGDAEWRRQEAGVGDYCAPHPWLRPSELTMLVTSALLFPQCYSNDLEHPEGPSLDFNVL